MVIKIILCIAIIISLLAVIGLHRRNIVMKKKFKNITEFFGDVDTVMNSVRYGNLSVRAEADSHKETKKLTKSINRMIETLNDREQMITEYQAELTKKNNFLETLLNSLSEGIIVCDEEFIIVDVNSNLKKWVPNIDLQSTKVEEIIVSPHDKKLEKLNNDEVFLKGADKDLFFKATTKLIDAQEHYGKYMIVITNYTDQKEIESLKEDFVATLTHDLKVPIIAESNMLEFFLKGKFGELSESQKEAINSMSVSNKELLDLVQTVLDTYKVKEGEIELNREKTSVKKLLKEIKAEMSPIAQKNNNKIVEKIKTDFELNIDYLQFKRVIKNLVNNAIIYGKPDTNIEITAVQKDNTSYIYVKDYGKGIAKEDIDKVFNKYYSAHKKFRKVGTGLGLYLSQKLIQAHGGTLEVTSKEGEWSEFVVSMENE